MADAHEQTLAHLRLLAHLPGYWELRALRRDGATRMTPRGSFWVVATATPDGLLYERLDQALEWADTHDRQGAELFVGVNARSMEGRTKAGGAPTGRAGSQHQRVATSWRRGLRPGPRPRTGRRSDSAPEDPG